MEVFEVRVCGQWHVYLQNCEASTSKSTSESMNRLAENTEQEDPKLRSAGPSTEIQMPRTRANSNAESKRGSGKARRPTPKRGLVPHTPPPLPHSRASRSPPLALSPPPPSRFALPSRGSRSTNRSIHPCRSLLAWPFRAFYAVRRAARSLPYRIRYWITQSLSFRVECGVPLAYCFGFSRFRCVWL